MRWALLLALAAACTRSPARHGDARGAPAPAAIAPTGPALDERARARAAIAPTGPSLYELQIPLRDAAGRTIALDVDRGHPTLVSMFYGSCAVACPALIDHLARLAAELPADARRDVRILLVSFDPGRDTPARLTELARAHHLDARWTLAAADDADARALAGVLGIKYRAIAGGEFFHTTVVVALDRDGRPLARMEGLGDRAGLEAAVKGVRHNFTTSAADK